MGADEAEPADTMMCCASCGTSECDDIKLKTCTACKLVKYCSVECQKKHRSQHKKACKKKVAEIRDDLLFKQPEISHYGDCPICLLPFPIDEKISRSAVMACCIKTICNGCAYANALREDKESLGHKCPFCRHPAPKSKEEAEVIAMRRIEAKDPVAMAQMGTKRLIEGDFSGAYEYWAKAAELGDAGAHYHLAVMYDEGQFVEKDMKKAMYHWEEAAIAGHPGARHNLGCYEGNRRKRERWRQDVGVVD